MKSYRSALSSLLVTLIALSACTDPTDSDNAHESSSSETGFGTIEILDERLNELVAPGAKLEVLASGFRWSEGPLWLDRQQLLVFSDVPANIIYSWSEKDGIQTYLDPAGYTGEKPREGGLGSNGLALDNQGRLVLCQHGDRRVARMKAGLSQPESSFETLTDHYQDQRFNSPNDLAYDSSGNLYFTDPPYGLEKGPGDPARELKWNGIYRLSPEGEVILLYSELSRPNGIGLSPDEKYLYVANSDPEEATWTSFRINTDGTLGDPELIHDASKDVETKPGLPDGLKVDRNGNIFATGPGGVLVFSPEGALLGTIGTGEPTANLAFNTDESMLYITANDKLMRLRLR